METPKTTLAARRVVGVGKAVLEEDPVLHAQGGQLTVTLTAGSTVSIYTGSGVQILQGTGTDDVQMVIQGTSEQLEEALNGDGTLANPGLIYKPSIDDDDGGTLTISVSDGSLTTTSTLNIGITPSEDPPVANDDTITRSEDSNIFNGDLFLNDSDPDTSPTPDVIFVESVQENMGTSPIPITLNTPHILQGGGTITFLANGTYVFNPGTAYDSLNVGQTVIESITYTINDGSGANGGAGFTDTATLTLTVEGANDAPTISTTVTSINYAEDAPATVINSAIDLADVDSAQLTGATIQITGNYISGLDTLHFTPIGNITSSFDLITGTLTLTGNDTVANYQAALRSVGYSNPSNDIGTTARTVSFSVTDGTSTSAVVTSEVVPVPSNDAPEINSTVTTVSFSEGGSPQVVNSQIVVSDVDSTQLTGATVTISGNHVPNVDVLDFTASGGITGSFDATAGVLTLTGTASLADYQSVLRTVTFENPSDSLDGNARTISFVVNDGTDPSTALTSQVTTVPSNDAPSIDGSSVLRPAVSFGGTTSDYVVSDPITGMPTGDFSLSLWVQDATYDNAPNSTVFTAAEVYFSYFTPGGSFGNGLFVFRNEEGRIVVGVNETFTSTDEAVPRDAEWHNIVVNYDATNGTIDVFYDGVQVGSTLTGFSNAGLVDGGTLVLGNEQDSPGGGFDANQALNGSQSEIQLWNNQLTQAEIDDIVAGTAPAGAPTRNFPFSRGFRRLAASHRARSPLGSSTPVPTGACRP